MMMAADNPAKLQHESIGAKQGIGFGGFRRNEERYYSFTTIELHLQITRPLNAIEERAIWDNGIVIFVFFSRLEPFLRGRYRRVYR